MEQFLIPTAGQMLVCQMVRASHRSYLLAIGARPKLVWLSEGAYSEFGVEAVEIYGVECLLDEGLKGVSCYCRC